MYDKPLRQYSGKEIDSDDSHTPAVFIGNLLPGKTVKSNSNGLIMVSKRSTVRDEALVRSDPDRWLLRSIFLNFHS